MISYITNIFINVFTTSLLDFILMTTSKFLTYVLGYLTSLGYKYLFMNALNYEDEEIIYNRNS